MLSNPEALSNSPLLCVPFWVAALGWKLLALHKLKLSRPTRVKIIQTQVYVLGVLVCTGPPKLKYVARASEIESRNQLPGETRFPVQPDFKSRRTCFCEPPQSICFRKELISQTGTCLLSPLQSWEARGCKRRTQKNRIQMRVRTFSTLRGRRARDHPRT